MSFSSLLFKHLIPSSLAPTESPRKKCMGSSSNTCILTRCMKSQTYGTRRSLGSLGLGSGLLAVFSLKDRPSILVKLEGGNDNVAWVNANGDRRAIRLVPLDTIDVDNPLFTVDLGDLSLTTLVFSSDNPDFVILTNGY